LLEKEGLFICDTGVNYCALAYNLCEEQDDGLW